MLAGDTHRVTVERFLTHRSMVQGLLTLRSTVEGLLTCRILGNTMVAASLKSGKVLPVMVNACGSCVAGAPCSVVVSSFLSGGCVYDLRGGAYDCCN